MKEEEDQSHFLQEVELVAARLETVRIRLVALAPPVLLEVKKERIPVRVTAALWVQDALHGPGGRSGMKYLARSADRDRARKHEQQHLEHQSMSHSNIATGSDIAFSTAGVQQRQHSTLHFC